MEICIKYYLYSIKPFSLFYTDSCNSSKINGMVLLVFGSVIKHMAPYDEHWANRMTRKLEEVLQIHGKIILSLCVHT